MCPDTVHGIYPDAGFGAEDGPFGGIDLPYAFAVDTGIQHSTLASMIQGSYLAAEPVHPQAPVPYFATEFNPSSMFPANAARTSFTADEPLFSPREIWGESSQAMRKEELVQSWIDATASSFTADKQSSISAERSRSDSRAVQRKDRGGDEKGCLGTVPALPTRSKRGTRCAIQRVAGAAKGTLPSLKSSSTSTDVTSGTHTIALGAKTSLRQKTREISTFRKSPGAWCQTRRCRKA